MIMHQSARIRQTDRVLMKLSLGCQNPHSLYCQTPLLISIIRDRFHCQSPSLLNPLQSPLGTFISLSDPSHSMKRDIFHCQTPFTIPTIRNIFHSHIIIWINSPMMTLSLYMSFHLIILTLQNVILEMYFGRDHFILLMG